MIVFSFPFKAFLPNLKEGNMSRFHLLSQNQGHVICFALAYLKNPQIALMRDDSNEIIQVGKHINLKLEPVWKI